MKALAVSLAAGAALCGAISTPVSAMSVAKLAAAASDLALDQNVRWVCGWYRCRWRPDYYRPRVYYGYGPGWYGYAPGWYGGWSGPGLYGRWW